MDLKVPTSPQCGKRVQSKTSNGFNCAGSSSIIKCANARIKEPLAPPVSHARELTPPVSHLREIQEITPSPSAALPSTSEFPTPEWLDQRGSNIDDSDDEDDPAIAPISFLEQIMIVKMMMMMKLKAPSQDFAIKQHPVLVARPPLQA